MSDEIKIPEANEIVPLLSALIGKDMRVGAESSPVEPSTIVEHLTVFVADDGTPVMLAGGDAPFAYFSGAALALIPKGRAEDAISGGEPDPDLTDNYREVMNVLTRVINDAGDIHVRLVPGSKPDLEALPEPRSGRAYEFDIDGYGTGALNFWKL